MATEQTAPASDDPETGPKASENNIKEKLSVSSWTRQTLLMYKLACFYLMNAAWSA